jgi:iron complex outermembrane receptor protein
MSILSRSLPVRPRARARRLDLHRALLAGTALPWLAWPATAQQVTDLPAINVTASRLDVATGTITGAATSVITAADIARSPGQSLQEIIAQTPGVQLQTLFPGVNGAYTTVDLRGFGAFASSNALVLINGRRVNDLDLMGVDFSSIPKESIERIEITRGNSGAVLYGDNAVGGVINIVTRTGVSGPPVSMKVEAGTGSFNQRQATAALTTHQGPWSTAVTGNVFTSDGWRRNNATNQVNGVGDLRYTVEDFSAFLTLSGDNSRVGLPGGRSTRYFLDNSNQLANDPRGTSSPFDYGDKQGLNATTGFTKTLWNGVDLIVDGGVRDKKQQSAFFGDPADPFAAFGASYTDSHLTTWSLTPRLSIKSALFGLPSSVLTGVDFYEASYNSSRSQYKTTAPIHVYDLKQTSLAAYYQQTVTVLPSTDLAYGGRVQRTLVSARDRLDATAPNYIGDLQQLPLDQGQTNTAYHIGLEHRFNEMLTGFARTASAFRTPNVDERVNAGPTFDAFFNPVQNNFDIRTQTSWDVEGGLRLKAGRFEMQSSAYLMDLKNEIHYDPVGFRNYNLDPTRRYGSETSASYRALDNLAVRGSFTFTRAVFREGQYAGNDVPLVSRFTGSAGVTWDIMDKYLVLDATVRAWSSRRMDNDQRNVQPQIPANATVDLKLSGAYDRYFWSAGINNLFNVAYYDYAIASATTLGVFNAYPLPGRTYMVKAGATF